MNESKQLSEIVDSAIQSDQLIKKLERELAVLKDELKVQGLALAAAEGVNSVKLEGWTGHATVALVKGGPKVRKGGDISKLREQLGEQFNQLFTEQVSYVPVPDFESRFAALAAGEQQAVSDQLDLFTSTSKVNFYPNKK